MQSARTITLAFILFELFPLDSVTKSCPIYNLKAVQAIFTTLHININISRCAECKIHNSCVYTFWVISFGTLSVTKSCHKKRVHSITWKPFKISSRNFIWISLKIRRRAKRKNHNSCIYILVISLGISSVNINICWMYNTIWHQKWGRHLCFGRKTKSSLDTVSVACNCSDNVGIP